SAPLISLLLTASNNSTASNTTHPSGNAHATNSYNTGGLAFAINTSDLAYIPYYPSYIYDRPTHSIANHPDTNVPVITTELFRHQLVIWLAFNTRCYITAHRDGSSSSLHSMDNGPSGTNRKLSDLASRILIWRRSFQIAHYESSKVTIKGSYYIQEPGT
ncbi:hypothetical protein BASA60_000626, partial [Batrachochytrium salamandrivorans]